MADLVPDNTRKLSSIPPTTQELLQEVIDGQTYSYRLVPQCKVCKAPDSIRNIIDSLLLFPKSYKEVLRHVRPLEEELGVESKDLIGYDSIRNHQRNHLPTDKAAIREIVEKRSSVSVLEGDNTLLTPAAIYETIAQKGWEDIVAGRVRPNLNQTMAAVEKLKEMDEKANAQFKPESLINQLNAIISAMKEVLPDEWLQKVLDKINQIEQDFANDPDMIEAEVIEDEEEF